MHMDTPSPKPAFRWRRLLLQILLALLTAALVLCIMLPAYMAPKSQAPADPIRRNR